MEAAELNPNMPIPDLVNTLTPRKRKRQNRGANKRTMAKWAELLPHQQKVKAGCLKTKEKALHQQSLW